MEQNTVEDIYNYINDVNLSKQDAIRTIQSFVKKQQEVAVDKALCTANDECYVDFTPNKLPIVRGILALKSQILKQLV